MIRFVHYYIIIIIVGSLTREQYGAQFSRMYVFKVLRSGEVCYWHFKKKKSFFSTDPYELKYYILAYIKIYGSQKTHTVSHSKIQFRCIRMNSLLPPHTHTYTLVLFATALLRKCFGRKPVGDVVFGGFFFLVTVFTRSFVSVLTRANGHQNGIIKKGENKSAKRGTGSVKR